MDFGAAVFLTIFVMWVMNIEFRFLELLKRINRLEDKLNKE